jgi:hypothetical protein
MHWSESLSSDGNWDDDNCRFRGWIAKNFSSDKMVAEGKMGFAFNRNECKQAHYSGHAAAMHTQQDLHQPVRDQFVQRYKFVLLAKMASGSKSFGSAGVATPAPAFIVVASRITEFQNLARHLKSDEAVDGCWEAHVEHAPVAGRAWRLVVEVELGRCSGGSAAEPAHSASQADSPDPPRYPRQCFRR